MKILKLKGVCLILIILTAFNIFATGCDFWKKDTGDEEGKGLDSESEQSSNGWIESAFCCEYKSDKTVFDIDDVTLDFYYGVHLLHPEEREEEMFNIPSFDLYFSNEENHRILIRHVEEDFVSEKYRCYYVKDENGKITSKHHYNHFETHTVPKELFTQESSFFYFSVYRTNSAPPDMCITSALIYYKLDGEKVTLSSKPFHLYEDNYEKQKNSSKFNFGFLRGCSAF